LSLVTPRKGYKSVPWLFGKEIEIPDEWEVKSVDCLGEIVTGTTPSTTIIENYGSEFLWATPSDLISTKNVVVTETKLSKKGFEQVRKLPKHSIMMTCIGMIGRTGLTSEEMSTNQQINSIITKNVNFEFVYYSLTFNQERISNSANQSVVQIINKKDFGKIKIIIPKNISEQQKIATILSNVDNLIESTGKVITHSKKVKTGLMQKLLTRGIGHVTFKKVPWLFGKEIEIPEEWEMNNLESISKIFDSLHITPKYAKEGYAMVRSTDIKYGNLNLDNTLRVSPEIFTQFTEKYCPQKYDIVMSRVGTYGVVSFVDTNEPFCLGQNTIIIQSIMKYFLYLSLRSNLLQTQIETIVDGSTQKTITLKNIKKLKLLIPPLPEQQKIASILSNIDDKITSQEKYKEKLEKLKKSLMQKLLTGEVRV